MSKRDFYEILGVNRDASDDEIKNLPQVSHEAPPTAIQTTHRPSENGECKEAYEILSDGQNVLPMTNTDTSASTHKQVWVAVAFGGGSGGFGDASGILTKYLAAEVAAEVEVTFQHLSWPDLRYNLEVTLEQAAHGTETKNCIPTMESCDPCDTGSGAKPARKQKPPNMSRALVSTFTARLLLDSTNLPKMPWHRSLYS